jgi:hypothetical protein
MIRNHLATPSPAGVSTHLISIRRRDQQRCSRRDAGFEISNYRAAAFTRPAAAWASSPSYVCVPSHGDAGQELEEPREGS